ncbi:MAG: porin [Armatimonadetes bacterium]|nr:porin [Armatimonadota bacterium]
MRWSIAAALGTLVVLGNFAAAQGGSASVETLQAEIARLKEQLAKLEKQLSELQKQQKAAEKATQRFEPISISGYIQMRYERDDSRPTDENNLATGRAKDNFRLRRVRLDVRGTPVKGVLYRLQVDASSEDKVALRDAFLELRSGEGVFTFGQFKVPLLEEVIESSAVRWTPERARVSTALFPGERDRGITYTWRKQGAPEITLGLFSGTRTREGDSLTTRKSWLVRLVQPLDKEGKLGKIWVGRMDGIGRREFEDKQIRNFDRERTVVGLLLTPISGLTIRGEWVDGKDAGNATKPTVKVRGWYALVGYKLPNQPITLYAKHDQYDPNRDAAGNTFKRNALGIQYDLNKMTRLNLTWENQDNPDATIWTFQTQVRY